MPKPSDPMVRDKIIRYKNPSPRSQMENIVTIDAVFNKVLVVLVTDEELLMLYFTAGGAFLCFSDIQ